MTEFSHKDLWIKRSNKYAVEVSHHTVPDMPHSPGEGVNRWAVYAYVYPSHRLFERFVGTDMFQDAACSLPFHGGPTYLRAHRNDLGEITCYQAGADYQHAYDERFAHFETKDDAYEVFADAVRLFEHLADLKDDDGVPL